MFYESNVLYKNIICLHVSMYYEVWYFLCIFTSDSRGPSFFLVVSR